MKEKEAYNLSSADKNKELISTIEEIKMLAEEMKKINKKIDLRNPLIDPLFFDKVKNSKTLVTEEQKAKWGKLYNYEIPKDEER